MLRWCIFVTWLTVQASISTIATQYPNTPVMLPQLLDQQNGLPEQDGSQTDDNKGYYVTSVHPLRSQMNANQNQIDKAEIQKNVTNYLEYIIGNGLEKYLQPCITCVGLVGNTISLLVMRMAHNRQTSCCVYMGALAITDNLFILTMILQWVSSDIVLGRPFTRVECKTMCATFIMSSFSSIFIVLSMTFDRFIAVCYPLHATIWCTARRAKTTISIIICTMLLYCIPIGLYSDMIDSKRCAILIVKTTFSIFYSWLGIFLGSALPYTVIIILNVSLIKTIRNRQSLFHNDKQNTDQTEVTGTTNKDMQLTIMLLSVTFTLIILTLPQNVRYILFIIVDPWQSVKMYATYVLLYNLTNKLYFSNSAINFFLYCISGSKFQKDVRTLFCGSKPQSS